MNERLVLMGRIPLVVPWSSHWLLVWGKKVEREQPETIRRLDLRDDHPNPDGKLFEGATHKHRWSVADNNAWAYAPDDIPHDPSIPPLIEDNYRAIFEAFANECGIKFGPDYIEPE